MTGAGNTGEKPRYHLNVVGDFYVVNGCCTLCGVPYENEAPALFSTDGEHCYVSQQPATAEEFRQMLNAIAGADTLCIRYAGTDPDTLCKLREAGEEKVCDHPAPPPLAA